MIRIAFAAVLIASLSLSIGSQTRTAPRDNAQKDSSLVEVKDDRFTGKRTVRMLPVKVAGNLEMALSGEINTARKPDYMEQDLGVSVMAEFATPYESPIKFVSDMDFIFLVDGKRTMRGAAGDAIGSDFMRKDGKRTAIGILSQSTLERVAAGRKIEMKFGATEVTLDETTLKNIRAFVAALNE